MPFKYTFITKTTFLWLSSTFLFLITSQAATARPFDKPHQFSARDLKYQSLAETNWEIAQFDSETETEIEIEEAPEVDVEPPEVDVEEVPAGENLGQSYVGIGGNIGITGEDSSVGDSGFALLGKTAFTSNLGLHGSVIFGDTSSTQLALTYGVPVTYRGSTVVYPFVGGGVVIDEFFDEFDLGGLITTGVDVPISSRFTGNASLNVGITDDETGLGLLLGVGYNL
ncbi:hypothetical protein [Myxosarcina sp. GI1(2024)]